MTRHRNDGLRKICECPRGKWAKCLHGWHVNYKPGGKAAVRLSLDRYIGHHIESKTEAQKLATTLETAVLKAHGHTPQWLPGRHQLAPASVAAYQAIDLHFHDLRHEAGSRWLENGWPIHHVKAMLGHASISTTDTYLNATRYGLRESMQRHEGPRRHRPRTSRRVSPCRSHRRPMRKP